MALDWYQILSLDVPPLLVAMFAGGACALLGNFLVLRRLSLMGDAISHAVLPGIVIAFLVSGSRVGLTVFIGAVSAGVVTVVMVEVVRRFGRVDLGAAMGVVFSILFALGVVLMEQAAARQVDLDADCLLHGQLETIFWYPPHTAAEFFSWETMQLLPGQVGMSFFVFVISLLFVGLLFKELRLVTFDPELANALGFRAEAMYYVLMIFVAGAVVASFEAVGSILVISMIICPAATARLLTDRLVTQLVLSVVIAMFCVVFGYVFGAFGPFWVGMKHSVNAAGMIAVVLGVVLGVMVFFAPQYGLLAKWWRNFLLSLQVYREDLLGILYRLEEYRERKQGLNYSEYAKIVGGGVRGRLAYQSAFFRGEASVGEKGAVLTEKGRDLAVSLVRSHRLWEVFLVKHLGIPAERVHQRATELEHFTTRQMTDSLYDSGEKPQRDPHGKVIPERLKDDERDN